MPNVIQLDRWQPPASWMGLGLMRAASATPFEYECGRRRPRRAAVVEAYLVETEESGWVVGGIVHRTRAGWEYAVFISTPAEFDYALERTRNPLGTFTWSSATREEAAAEARGFVRAATQRVAEQADAVDDWCEPFFDRGEQPPLGYMVDWMLPEQAVLEGNPQTDENGIQLVPNRWSELPGTYTDDRSDFEAWDGPTLPFVAHPVGSVFVDSDAGEWFVSGFLVEVSLGYQYVVFVNAPNGTAYNVDRRRNPAGTYQWYAADKDQAYDDCWAFVLATADRIEPAADRLAAAISDAADPAAADQRVAALLDELLPKTATGPARGVLPVKGWDGTTAPAEEGGTRPGKWGRRTAVVLAIALTAVGITYALTGVAFDAFSVGLAAAALTFRHLDY